MLPAPRQASHSSQSTSSSSSYRRVCVLDTETAVFVYFVPYAWFVALCVQVRVSATRWRRSRRSTTPQRGGAQSTRQARRNVVVRFVWFCCCCCRSVFSIYGVCFVQNFQANSGSLKKARLVSSQAGQTTPTPSKFRTHFDVFYCFHGFCFLFEIKFTRCWDQKKLTSCSSYCHRCCDEKVEEQWSIAGWTTTQRVNKQIIKNAVCRWNIWK